MIDGSDAIRLAEGELVDVEDRAASVLALMTKISDPDQRRDWAACAESLHRQAALKREQLRGLRSRRG